MGRVMTERMEMKGRDGAAELERTRWAGQFALFVADHRTTQWIGRTDPHYPTVMVYLQLRNLESSINIAK